jgi:hypothetical protein
MTPADSVSLFKADLSVRLAALSISRQRVSANPFLFDTFAITDGEKRCVWLSNTSGKLCPLSLFMNSV